MRKPRTNTILLVGILLMIGVLGQAWLDGSRSRESSAVEISLPVHTGWMESVPRVNLAKVAISGSPLLKLSPDAAVLLNAMCDLQLLAAGSDLSLNPDQWSGLAAVVVRAQAMRHNYEASIARVQLISPGHYRVEIPAYIRAGEALRNRFNEELRVTLGEAIAREVMTKLGAQLEARFTGFGMSMQTLDVVRNLADAEDIQIARTATYWDSVKAVDRLTIRQEIHFPIWEDPTGDSWQTWLAKVGDAG